MNKKSLKGKTQGGPREQFYTTTIHQQRGTEEPRITENIKTDIWKFTLSEKINFFLNQNDDRVL